MLSRYWRHIDRVWHSATCTDEGGRGGSRKAGHLLWGHWPPDHLAIWWRDDHWGKKTIRAIWMFVSGLGHRISTVRSSQGLSLSISLSTDILLLSNFHSRVVAHHSCRDCCSLLIVLLHFSSLACQSLVVRRHHTNNFCDMILMPWEKPHVSNWCHSDKWWIMQCMNLQLSHQMTTALTTSHGSRVARTIRSSYPATKALVKSGSKKQAILRFKH